jgi:hypothetical protein
LFFLHLLFYPKGPKEIVYDIADTGLVDILPEQKKEVVKPKPIPPATKPPSSTVKFPSKMVIVPNSDSTETLHDLKNEAIGSNTNIIINGEAHNWWGIKVRVVRSLPDQHPLQKSPWMLQLQPKT